MSKLLINNCKYIIGQLIEFSYKSIGNNGLRLINITNEYGSLNIMKIDFEVIFTVIFK